MGEPMIGDLDARIEALRASIDRAFARVTALDEILDRAFHRSPHAILVIEADGRIEANAAGAHLVVAIRYAGEPYGIFADEGGAPLRGAPWGPPPYALGPALVWARTAAHREGTWLELSVVPLDRGARLCILRDASMRVALARAIAERRRELAARARARAMQLAELRETVESLPVPLVRLGERAVAVAVAGIVDGPRSARIGEAVLAALGDASSLVVDLSGAAHVDDAGRAGLAALAARARAAGVEVALSGLDAELAIELAALDGLRETAVFPTLADAVRARLRGPRG